MEEFPDADLTPLERALVQRIVETSRRLRNELTALRGLQGDALAMSADLARRDPEAVTVLRNRVARALATAEDAVRSLPLLGLPLRIKRVDVGGLARRALDEYEAGRPSLKIAFAAFGSLDAAADEGLLLVALRELLVGVVRARAGSVEVGRLEGGEFYVALRAKALEYAAYVVDAERRGDRLPSPFWAVDLVRAREAIERHGGRLWIGRAPDGGEALSFTLG